MLLSILNELLLCLLSYFVPLLGHQFPDTRALSWRRPQGRRRLARQLQQEQWRSGGEDFMLHHPGQRPGLTAGGASTYRQLRELHVAPPWTTPWLDGRDPLGVVAARGDPMGNPRPPVIAVWSIVLV